MNLGSKDFYLRPLRLFLRLVFPLLLVMGQAALADPVDWPMVTLTQITTTAFTHPTVITHAGDNSGRLFVAEQTGRIWIIQGSNVLASPFLDISSRVLTTGAEQGLLGLAFPPGYKTNSHFYVDYTRTNDGAVVISRFSVPVNTTNAANAGSEQIIKVIPKANNFHNGGQIAFGPDGLLYIAVGDDGPEGDPQRNAQNSGTLLGKLLRINVESSTSPYAVPTNNPFVANTNYLPEIWALGLRNPWRFSFDRVTGDLYIGDVGQNRFEEVDFQTNGSAGGQNYGWNIREGATNYNVPAGFTNFSSLTEPVTWYDHLAIPTDIAGAVTGGYVSREAGEPRLAGVYFFGDYVAGWIWGLERDGTNWQRLELVNPTWGVPHMMISTFGENEQGQIHVADYGPGKIYRIQDTHQVWTPVFTPTNGYIASNMVTVSCLTTGAVIHFTTNGIDPTPADPVVLSGGTIPVTSGVTNKLCAYRTGYTNSGVATGIFQKQVGTPVFNPPGGPVPSNTLVTITTVTPNAKIYYTLNGTTPTTNSLLYTSPLVVSDGTNLIAAAFAASYLASPPSSAAYSAAQVITPVFTPSTGPVTNGTLIVITCATPAAVIHYTVNGSIPSKSSPVYSAPFTINGGVTVNAYAVTNRYVDSPVQSTFFQLVQTATPLFNPGSGAITNGTHVVMSCATPGAVIWYTTNGATPTAGSPVYTGPVMIDGFTTLNALATAAGHLDSTLQSVFYPLSDYKYPTIVSTVAGSGQAGASNAVGVKATFSSPLAVCVDAGGNLYVADTGNNQVRKITPAGVVTTLASGFSTPTGITIDPAGRFYVVNASGNQIMKMDGAGNVTLFAGSGISGRQDGPAATAQFMHLDFVTCDRQTNLYAGDWGVIRKIAPDGTVSTLAGSGIYSGNDVGVSAGVSVNASNYVYAANTFGRVFEISPAGDDNLFAGGTLGYGDGPRAQSMFSSDYTLRGRGTAVDRFGNIYVSDGSQIRKIETNGWVSTLAGSTQSGFVNGNAHMARFYNLSGMCVDTNGNLYVADTDNNAIRKISPDTAGIGIPDDWQMAYFGHVGVDPNADPDHDGMSNYREFWSGTNPTNGASFFAMKSLVIAVGNHAQIKWPTVSGKTYTVQYSDDLLTWNPLGNTMVGDGTTNVVSDPATTRQAPHRMYRVYQAF